MVLYIMQTYMGLPVIEESKVGCDLEEFLKKPIDVQVKALKGVFDEYSSHYKKLDPVILFTNFIIFYGCAFDYSTCIQIVPSEEVPKETYPTFRISDAFTPTRNLFSMRPMLEVHFKNLLLFGVLDFLRPNNREDYIQEIGYKTTVIFRSKVFFPYEFCRDPTLNEPPGFLIWKSNSFSMPRQECFICYGSHAERYCNFLTLMNFSNLKVECKIYDLLKDSMEKYYENERVTDEHLKVADTFIADIKAEILDKTGFEVEFTKFGSWINGFGIKTSDYDLCVSHVPEGDDIKLEGIDLLHILSLALEKKCTFEEIYTAEVPILKFKSKLKDRTVTGDISASNLLAFENSKLLKEYSLFDDRVGILGVVIKKWASAFSINDASHRTLSSYALIIMLIHYLQHTKPPVLPYLQDSKEFDLKEKLFDNKYSVQFAQPTEEFKSKFRKNKGSVSRLLGGFFGYFLNFDWREKVVQIRTPLVLFKHDKDWEKFAMAIEDPFKLEHNLSRKRMVILKSMNLMQAELRKKNSVFHEKNFCFNSSAFKSINPFFQNRARANKRRNVKKAAENSKSN
ncbi:Nucleotidyltransferase domain protein [Aphelenchoides bicaudatus]|nr:Nucleotidyltransferase domain protein [Aphelenchoides bicaudatus]